MKKFIIIFQMMFILLLPINLLAQGNRDHRAGIEAMQKTIEDYTKDEIRKKRNFEEGKDLTEEWMTKGFAKLDAKLESYVYNIVQIAKVIGALGALITLSVMGYQMMLGNREWDVLAMLKPFGICIIILNWYVFTNIIKSPFEGLGKAVSTQWEKASDEIEKKKNLIYVEKWKYKEKVLEHEYDLLNKRSEDASWYEVDEKLSLILAHMELMGRNAGHSIQHWVSEFVDGIVTAFFRFAVYFMIFIQKLISTVLIMVGPISFAIALFPGFQSSITNWITKFTNVSLYTFILYTVLNFGAIIILASYDMTYERYKVVNDMIAQNQWGEIQNMAMLGGDFKRMLWNWVALFIIASGCFMVPTIADMVISAGGSMMMNQMKQGVSQAKGTAQGSIRNIQGAMGQLGKLAPKK